MPGNNNLFFFDINKFLRTMDYYYKNIQNKVKYVFLKCLDLMIHFQTIKLIGLIITVLTSAKKYNFLK